uniref:PDZ domain-containing protein n=1 Tax=Chaetoceros debilis TaxID=122233 RepID=A0A7S3PZM9_9STRA
MSVVGIREHDEASKEEFSSQLSLEAMTGNCADELETKHFSKLENYSVDGTDENYPMHSETSAASLCISVPAEKNTLHEGNILRTEMDNHDDFSRQSPEDMQNEMERLRKDRDEARRQTQCYEEKFEKLFLGLSLISELSSLDPNATSELKDLTDERCDDGFTSVILSSYSSRSSSIQKRLDNLQQSWKLEDTPIPKIVASIYMLHSNVINLQKQADVYNTSETSQQTITSLQDQISSYKSDNKKLKKAAKRLLADNKKMREKVNERRAEKRNLVKSVKEYVKKKREEEITKEELFVATKLTVHETVLKSTQGNRQRSWTGDSAVSTFSDLGTYLEKDESFRSIEYGSNENLTDSYECATPSTSMDYAGFLGDSSVSSCSALSIAADDYSSPTVRFALEPSDGSSQKNVPASYSLTLPRKNLGLQFSQMEIDIPTTANIGKNDRHPLIPRAISNIKTKKRISLASGFNRKRAFSDSAVLKLANSGDEESMYEKIPTKNVTEGWKILSDKSAKRSDHEEVSKCSNDETNINSACREVFLVKDFQGFDTSLNVRPTLGARLIAIDGILVTEGKWSMEKVLKILSEKGDGKVVLTFRSDPLNKEQKKKLEIGCESDTRKESTSAAKKSTKGLLNKKSATSQFSKIMSKKKSIDNDAEKKMEDNIPEDSKRCTTLTTNGSTPIKKSSNSSAKFMTNTSWLGLVERNEIDRSNSTPKKKESLTDAFLKLF